MGVTKYFVLNGKRFVVTYTLRTVQMDSRRNFVAPHHEREITPPACPEECEALSGRMAKAGVLEGANHITITQEDGSIFQYSLSQINYNEKSSSMSLLINNQMHIVAFDSGQPQSAPYVSVQGKKYEVQQDQRILGAQKDKTLSCKPASMISGTQIKSPLAGRVVRVLSCAGAAVLAGQPLVVIESMKMENEICASRDGIIKTLFIALGNLVQPNQPLIELEMKGGRDVDPENPDGQATI